MVPSHFPSLRTRLLLLFALLAIGPLVAIGVLSYVQSRRAVERLVATQTQTIAARAAEEIERRYALLRSDLMLVSDNAETQQLLGTAPERPADARARSSEFLRQAWRQLAPSYYSIELRDSSGTIMEELSRETPDVEGATPLVATSEPSVVAEQPIREWGSGRRLGTVLARPRLSSLLPREALDARFGQAGYSVVVDRAVGRILYHPRRAMTDQPWRGLLGRDSAEGGSLDLPTATLRFHEHDSLRIASAVSLTTPPWTILAVGTVDEFSAPFARTRNFTLLLVLAVTSAVGAIFTLAIRRATHSLEALTVAADDVGRGNFMPALPAAGRDEVGRLTRAFETMTQQVAEIMAQIERSRQMAAVGEFAAEIAHEIRNPLTSLKLNQQRLERLMHGGRMPAEAEEPVRISLREADRLDRVVRGVLDLGRPRSIERRACQLREVIDEALEIVRPQAERQQITIENRFAAADGSVLADREQLRGALLNLFLNAVQAMPDGGTLRVHTTTTETTLRLRIADSGRGVAPEARAHLFHPFFTTRPDGTGLGLALALRTIEEHDGTLTLDNTGDDAGAAFIIELPLLVRHVGA